VHPSTVSRAVASKYAHTSQGVLELRSFFSEAVNGPEGGGMSLLTLKRLVKKMIDEEDSTKPLTDDQIAKKAGRCGHPRYAADGCKISRRHAYPQHASAAW